MSVKIISVFKVSQSVLSIIICSCHQFSLQYSHVAMLMSLSSVLRNHLPRVTTFGIWGDLVIQLGLKDVCWVSFNHGKCNPFFFSHIFNHPISPSPPLPPPPPPKKKKKKNLFKEVITLKYFFKIPSGQKTQLGSVAVS